ncbi:UPF0488 protein C8orf33 isoform X1 [Hydra vulgaris]|uniref:UPF0488 protein C8orf33 n=1 Tax=Hydra vulgaris TaxID=6087 RepID=T2M5I8_HYDVU|nr:UPF0488 protein C8orf33 isoform X1 [Hydra vulgaris]
MKNEDDEKKANKKAKQQSKNKKKKEMMKSKKQQEQKQQELVAHENISNEEDNFAEELQWCIQQIELGLKTRKPSPDQVIKSQKLMQQLMSTKTPKAKKRMLMKLNFGNYREKIAAQIKMQVSPGCLVSADEILMKKSVFIKKKSNNMPVLSTSIKSEEVFYFNFPQPSIETDLNLQNLLIH